MLLVVFLLMAVVPATAHIDNLRAMLHRHHRRSQGSALSKTDNVPDHKIICVNGVLNNGKCSCNWGFRGTYCEKKMHCNSYERESNGSCTSCAPNFSGSDCVDIECKHGSPHEYDQKCVCVPPYKGNFCDQLETEDVYLLYNSRVAVLGPLGALSIIPLILIYYGCEHFAKKRQIRRIEKLWIDQTDVSVDSDKVKYLLEQ